VVNAGTVIEDRSNIPMEVITRGYRERHSVLTLMRQLNRLVSAIQIHRGVSLAHLAGDGLFTDDVAQVQSQVNQRLLVLSSSTELFESLVPPQEQQKIQHGWNTVCHDWEGDALLENFEYHSFLIEQLLQLSGSLGHRLKDPLWGALKTQTNLNRDDPILNLVCRQIPELIEHLARIRGLATHAAVVGACDEEHQKKLQYWLQCVERQNGELIQRVDSLEPSINRQWRSLAELKDYELKLAFFLNTVGKDIIQGGGEKADARQLFTLGSEIIDAYVDGVDGGIALLHDRLEAELETWLTDD